MSAVIELKYSRSIRLWGEEDSNLRRRTPADLQSAPVGHFGISPVYEPMEGFEPPTS
jgi:hypothetical protein